MILLREEHEAFKAAGYTHWEDYGSGGYNTGRGCMGRIIGKATTDFGDNPDWNHVAHVIEEDDVVYCFCSGRTASGCGRGLDSSGGKAAKIKEMREYPVKIREYKQICLDNNLMS